MNQTLDEFMSLAWIGDAEYHGLDDVIRAIAEGTRQVQNQVQAAGLTDILGATGDINVQGEMVQRLDSKGSEIFVDELSRCARVAAVGSEELAEPVIMGDSANQSYLVLMDPVDGSSNIDVAVSIGSIFGIWRHDSNEPVTESALLRPGSEQVAAAYSIYGSSTILVVATRKGVQGFTMDATTGEFGLTHPNVTIPAVCQYYSANDGNFKRFDETTKKAMVMLRDTYSLRYVGSLVADFHRNLLKGGIYLYPRDRKSPDGKLRLMYEANPLGFVVEQAGGAASSGNQRIMEIQPTSIHQRTPLILGNKDVVERTVAIMDGA